MELNKNEMRQINGGVNWGILGGIASAVIFIIGVFSGYTNPSRCNN